MASAVEVFSGLIKKYEKEIRWDERRFGKGSLQENGRGHEIRKGCPRNFRREEESDLPISTRFTDNTI